MRAKASGWAAGALLLLLAACNPELQYGDGALVSCTTDNECIDGFVCTGVPARCVSVDGLDATGVLPIAPPNDAVVADGRVTLAWRGVPGAESYLVEVATDAAGTMPIAGSPFRVADGQQILVLEGLRDDVTHYWSVRSDVTVPDVRPETWRFDVVGPSLHVYCPSQRTSCAPATGEVQSGNLSRPFTRVQDAIDVAERLRRDLVLVAGRGAGAAYEESLAVSRGIVLEGGYDPSFATRDPALHEAIVRDAVSALAVSLTDAPTIVDGLQFVAGAPDTPIAVGVSVDNVRGPVTLRQCRVAVSGASAVSIGVRVSSSLIANALLLQDVEVEALGGPSVRGVVGREASLRLERSHVVAESATSADAMAIEVASALSQLEVVASRLAVVGPEVASGIQSTGAVATLVDSTIEVGLAQTIAPRFSNGVVFAVGVTRALVTGNRLSVRGRSLARGLHLLNADALVANNLIGTFGCPSGDSQGLLLRFFDTAKAVIGHNTIVVSPGGATTHAFAMDSGSQGVIRNNVAARLGTCPSASQGLTDLSALAQWDVSDNLASSELPLGVTISNAALAQAGTDVFVAVAGADGDAAAFGDNDWHLAPALAGYAAWAPPLGPTCATALSGRFPGPDVCAALAVDATGLARKPTAVTPGALETF